MMDYKRFSTWSKDHAIDWKIRINFEKCETILFHPPVVKCNSNIRNNWRNFGIKSYFNIDMPGKHIDIQIDKAKKAVFF